MALLAGILLRDLQFDSLICFLQCSEKRRGGLADLEVDRAVFDLQHYIVIELAIQFGEVVIGGRGAVVLRIPPVHVMVVYEPSVENQAAMSLERAGDYV